MMVFVILRMISEPKILKKWFGCSVVDTASFLDVCSELSVGNLDKGCPLPDEYSTVTTRVSVIILLLNVLFFII